jgi:hypothetical protein
MHMSEHGAKRTITIEHHDDCSTVTLEPPIGQTVDCLASNPNTCRLLPGFVDVVNGGAPVASVYTVTDLEFRLPPRSTHGDKPQVRKDIAASVGRRVMRALSESGVMVAERILL